MCHRRDGVLVIFAGKNLVYQARYIIFNGVLFNVIIFWRLVRHARTLLNNIFTNLLHLDLLRLCRIIGGATHALIHILRAVTLTECIFVRLRL